MSAYPAAMRPVYTMEEADAPLSLYSGAVVVRQASGAVTRGNGCIRLVWLPEPRLAFDAALETELHLSAADGVMDLELPDVGRSVRLVPRGYTLGSHPAVTGEIKPAVFGGGSVHALVFEVANFGDWVGTRIESTLADGSPVDYCGRLELSGAGWKFTLDGIAEFHALQAGGIRAQFQAGAGFAFTHVGRLEKIDGSEIEESQIGEILTAVQLFLSFMQGRRTPVVLPIGLDLAGDKIWEEWACPPGTPWREVPHWTPEFNFDPALVTVAFESFLTLWFTAPRWQDSLSTVLHWYLEANVGLPPSPETVIALSQIGLELLSFMILVKKDAAISKGAFDNLGAAEKIERLLDHYGIDKDIPANLSALISHLEGVTKGPDSLVNIRNHIIHPKFHRPITTELTGARFQASKLGMYYLEISMLRMLGYSGYHTSRINKRELPIPGL